MPNPLFDLVGGAIKSIIEPATNLVDNLHTSQEEKDAAKAELQKIANAAMAVNLKHAETIANAQRDIVVAELKQDDNYTKRARPSLVYGGLVAMFLNHVVLPWIAYFRGLDLPTIDLPTEFWIAWGGVTGAWAVGRSVEKRARIKGEEIGKATQFLTGAGGGGSGGR